MAPKKRKYDEIQNSDSDEPSFGKQILPVADLPDDFDDEPIDGMQYLFTVRRDAKALPQFTRAVNPYESVVTTPIPSNTSNRRELHSALPSLEWRELSESRWRNFHKNFRQPTIGTACPSFEQIKMPRKGERDTWWDFFAGKPESEWNRPRQSRRKEKLKQKQRHEAFVEGRMHAWDEQEAEEHEGEQKPRKDTTAEYSLETSGTAVHGGEFENALELEPQDTLPTPTGTPVPPDGTRLHTDPMPSFTIEKHVEDESSTYSPREPTPKLLKLIDEPMALRLLTYFTFWIHQQLRAPDVPTYRLTNTHARWMSSLLLQIDAYISADDINLLRNLVRACLAFIKTLDSERGKLTPWPEASTKWTQGTQAMGEQACWIIISGIIGIWGQRDLWFDAETDPASVE